MKVAKMHGTPVCSECFDTSAAEKYKRGSYALIRNHPPLLVKRCVICQSNLNVLLVRVFDDGPTEPPSLRLRLE